MNVLLDHDGTLTDSRKGIVACIQYALRSLGHETPEESALLRYVGPPLQASFRELLPADGSADTERAVAAYRERYVAVGMFENEVYPQIPEALQALRNRGARLFVATSKPRVYAQRILDHFQLTRFFDDIHGSELDGRRTDKTELIAHILTTSGLGGSQTTMVGDRYHDAVGAKANGIRAVGVLWGYGSRVELSNAGVDTFLEAPSELGALAFAHTQPLVS